MSDLDKPRQVVLVTTRHHFRQRLEKEETEKNDIITVAWHTPLSFEPELYGISIGKTRFSWRMIKESRVFCINFVPYSMEKQAVLCGTSSGENTDKYAETDLTMEECDNIDCGKIKEALGWMECEVVNELDTGDHTFFIARVISSSGEGEGKRLMQDSKTGFTTTID